MKTTFSTKGKLKDFVNQQFENQSGDFSELEYGTSAGISSTSEIGLESKVERLRAWQKQVISILHQVFFFFPSVFLLFMGSMAVTFHVAAQSGVSLLTPEFLASVLSIFGVVYGGHGNLKNLRDYLAPASIAVYGVLIGLAMAISPSLKQFLIDEVNFLYLFPVALMLPFIVKLWNEGSGE